MHLIKPLYQQYAEQNDDQGVLFPVSPADIDLCLAISRPTIQSDMSLVWRDILTGAEASVNDGTYLSFNDVTDTLELPSTTFKSYAAMYKPTTTTQPLMECLSEQGSEKVANGDFSDGTNGWNSGRCVFTIDTGRAKIITNVGVSNGTIYTNWISSSAKSLKLRFDYESTSTEGCRAIVAYNNGSTDVSSTVVNFDSSDGVKSLTSFYSGDDFIRIRIIIYQLGAEQTAYFDNVSIKEIPTLSLDAGTPTTTGIATPTTFKQSKGDWSLIGFSNPDDIIGKVNVGKVGQDFMNGGVYNIYQFPKELTEADRTWLLANPNANKTEAFAALGISSGSCYTCGEGAGDYVVDVWAELESGLLFQQDFESSLITSAGGASILQASVTDGEGGIRENVQEYTTNTNASSHYMYLAHQAGTNFYRLEYYIPESNTVLNGIEISMGGYVSSLGTTKGKWSTLFKIPPFAHVSVNPIRLYTSSDTVRSYTGNGEKIYFSIYKEYNLLYATINGCSWETGELDGRHGSIEIRTTPEINGETICLPSPDGINDYFGNAIDGSLLYDGRGLNLSKYDYATFDAITVARAGGAIVVDFVGRSWIDGNAGGYHTLLGNSITTYDGIFLDSDGDDIKVESDTDADSWTDVASAVSMESRLKLVLNADSIVLTKTKIDDGALTQIDSQTPTDDLTLSNISNSNSTVRMNGWVKNIKIFNRPLTDHEMEII